MTIHRTFTPSAIDLRAEADLIGQRIAYIDQLIAASKRAARIVDRVMPLNRSGCSALDNPNGFVANTRRQAARQYFYAEILPLMNAKTARIAPAVNAGLCEGFGA